MLFRSVGVGTGQANTDAMLAAGACGAASAADSYATSTQTDWHLPSKGDLQLAVTNLATKGISLPSGKYWTSSGGAVTSGNGAGAQNAYADFIDGSAPASPSPEWQYLQVPADRASTSVLSDWQPSGNEVISGVAQWDGNLTSGNYPFVQKVVSAQTTGVGVVPAGSLVVHPDDSGAGVGVAWTNRLGYSVQVDVSAALKLAFPTYNTDGISYYVQRGLVGDNDYALIGSGSIASGTTSATTVTGSTISVAPGSSIYVVVGRNGSYAWDHTILDFNVTPSSRGANVVNETGAASVTGISDFAKVRAIRTWQRRGSCQEIKESTGTNANGVYTISVTYQGVVTPTQAYC